MARKKKGLPFIVQPRLQPIVEIVGTEDSGQIEIERKGYLTVSEKAIVQSAMKGDESLAETMRAAAKIAQAEGMTVGEVFNDIGKDPRPEYLEKHEDTLLEMFSSMMQQEQRMKLVAVTALILTRVDAGWDAASTSDLAPELIDAIFQLYQEEEKRSVEALEEAAKQKAVEKKGTEGKD